MTRHFAVFCLALLALPAVARSIPLLCPAPGKVVKIAYVTRGGFVDIHVRDYLSPDGKYIARITREEGEGGYFPALSVLEYHAKKRNRDTGGFMGPTVADFVWLPRHPHSLVVACDSSGDMEGGALLFWRGPGKMTAFQESHDVGDDNFSIVRVSPDGHTLFYKRYGNDAPVPSNYDTAKVRRLKLPR